MGGVLKLFFIQVRLKIIVSIKLTFLGRIEFDSNKLLLYFRLDIYPGAVID
jgi:hypothetical protein